MHEVSKQVGDNSEVRQHEQIACHSDEGVPRAPGEPGGVGIIIDSNIIGAGKLHQQASPSPARQHKTPFLKKFVYDLACYNPHPLSGDVPGPLGISLSGKALAAGAWSLEARQIREHGIGPHRAVDDTPAGGGAGMVLRADVLAAAIDAIGTEENNRPRLLMSPRGAPLTQARVRELAAGPGALIVCGRFEGVDERVIEARGLEEISVGDYILSGGEIAAMAVIDACVGSCPA
jgi:hypothetical protein